MTLVMSKQGILQHTDRLYVTKQKNAHGQRQLQRAPPIKSCSLQELGSPVKRVSQSPRTH